MQSWEIHSSCTGGVRNNLCLLWSHFFVLIRVLWPRDTPSGRLPTLLLVQLFQITHHFQSGLKLFVHIVMFLKTLPHSFQLLWHTRMWIVSESPSKVVQDVKRDVAHKHSNSRVRASKHHEKAFNGSSLEDYDCAENTFTWPCPSSVI